MLGNFILGMRIILLWNCFWSVILYVDAGTSKVKKMLTQKLKHINLFHLSFGGAEGESKEGPVSYTHLDVYKRQM